MALKAHIVKVSMSISNMDTHYYETENLTVAQHPSETDERLMVRLLAYALLSGHDSEHLKFTKGLSSDEEPELWQMHLDGTIDLWVELGLPSDERLRKACNKAERVVVYVYGSNHSVEPWWAKTQTALSRFNNLSVIRIPQKSSEELQSLTATSMSLQCMIEDSEVSVASDETHLTIIPEALM